jgi:ankyrin repeat protein
VHAAGALGDEVALSRHLERDSGCANAVHDEWTPLAYVCASPLGRLSARHAMGLLTCAERLLEAGAEANALIPDDERTPGRDSPMGIPAVFRAMMSGNMAIVVLLRRRGVAEPHDAAKRWFARHAGPDASGLRPAFGDYFRRPEVRRRVEAEMAKFKENGGELHHRMPDDPRELQQLRAPNIMGAKAHLWAAMLDRGYDQVGMAQAGGAGLHTAASYAPAEFIELILERGGDPNARDDQGRSVLATAVRAGNVEVADLLLARGAVDDTTPVDRLLGACQAGDPHGARQIVAEHPELPASIAREDADVLVRAAGRGEVNQVRLMLDLGIRPDGRDEAGATALHQAAWRGQVDVVRLLLDHGASPRTTDELYGDTPRDWAVHGSLHAHGARDRCLKIERLLEQAERGDDGG